jgi:hypothetical protein
LLDEVLPPNVGMVMEAFPPAPPVPPLPFPVADPPTDAAPEIAAEAALPLSPLCTFDELPPASPKSRSPDGLAAASDVDVDVGVEAPPVAAEVAVLVAAPPAPAVVELEFEPAPPAPPVRLTEIELMAELVCVNVLVFVVVLLPEFVPDEEFDWLVAPCVTSSPSAVATNDSARMAAPASMIVCSFLTYLSFRYH